jgi:hypothetical protein
VRSRPTEGPECETGGGHRRRPVADATRKTLQGNGAGTRKLTGVHPTIVYLDATASWVLTTHSSWTRSAL